MITCSTYIVVIVDNNYYLHSFFIFIRIKFVIFTFYLFFSIQLKRFIFKKQKYYSMFVTISYSSMFFKRFDYTNWY